MSLSAVGPSRSCSRLVPMPPVNISQENHLSRFERKYAITSPQNEANDSGWHRIRDVISRINDEDVTPWEVDFIMRSILYGGIAGAAFGTTFNNIEIVRDFKRRHAMHIFHGQQEAKRKLTDYIMLMSLRRGIYLGWRVALMSGAISSLTLASLTYHNDVRIVEIGGCSALCTGVWRLKGGLRAAAASALIGFTFGTAGGIGIKIAEKISQKNVSDWRLEQATNYMTAYIKKSKERDAEIMANVDSPSTPLMKQQLSHDVRIGKSEQREN